MKPKPNAAYREKKKFFSTVLTVYGRNPVLEALSAEGVDVYRLHLAESNAPSSAIEKIVALAKRKNAEILFHSRAELSRISKNQKQDQGVAVDLQLKGYRRFEDCHTSLTAPRELLALDGITNPQNLGMIIRSVCASPIDALLLPEKGCAKLDSLVIKASAGALFRAPIVRCENLSQSLLTLRDQGAEVVGLDANAPLAINELSDHAYRVFVLGNETHGLSGAVRKICNHHTKLPMENGIDSLNVAVTAGIIAFRSLLR